MNYAEGSLAFSPDVILLAVVVGAPLTSRYYLELPRLVPNSRLLTAILILCFAAYSAIDLAAKSRRTSPKLVA